MYLMIKTVFIIAVLIGVFILVETDNKTLSKPKNLIMLFGFMWLVDVGVQFLLTK